MSKEVPVSSPNIPNYLAAPAAVVTVMGALMTSACGNEQTPAQSTRITTTVETNNYQPGVLTIGDSLTKPLDLEATGLNGQPIIALFDNGWNTDKMRSEWQAAGSPRTKTAVVAGFTNDAWKGPFWSETAVGDGYTERDRQKEADFLRDLGAACTVIVVPSHDTGKMSEYHTAGAAFAAQLDAMEDYLADELPEALQDEGQEVVVVDLRNANSRARSKGPDGVHSHDAPNPAATFEAIRNAYSDGVAQCDSSK